MPPAQGLQYSQMQDLNETQDIPTTTEDAPPPKPARVRKPRAKKIAAPEAVAGVDGATEVQEVPGRLADEPSTALESPQEEALQPRELDDDDAGETPGLDGEDDGTGGPSRSQRRRLQRKRAAARRAAEGPIVDFPGQEAAAEEPEEDAEAPVEAEAVEKPKRTRKPRQRKEPGEKQPVDPARVNVPAPFMHMSEAEFGGILDFYGIEWRYEPRSFPLRWEHGRVMEAFTPDFYLPQFDLYVELTTLKSGLRAEKNRKLRLIKEIYPEVNIRLFHKAELFRFLTKYGYGPMGPDDVPDVHRILIQAAKLQQRVMELGTQISRDYADREPVLIGVLRGVVCFIGDLVPSITVPVCVDFLAFSGYSGTPGAFKILKDLDENIKGRDVILVEDIVDTGLTLNVLLEYLATKKPASIKVCTLLDKKIRRLTNVTLDYVGFEIPDEFVVGYGLDFRQRYRNLPFIGVLKHELLP